MGISNRINEVKRGLPENVELILATKTRSSAEILEAVDRGAFMIGENYVQEAWGKYEDLKGKVEMSLIGHLQRNKVKKALKIFDMIETVDSVRLAAEINKRANEPLEVLIEVNSGEESQKSGVVPGDVENLVLAVSKMKNIRLKGLMTMAPLFIDSEEARPYFAATKKLFDELADKKIDNVSMEVLSMGMSGTYKIAIEEGATRVRVGSLVFGERRYE